MSGIIKKFLIVFISLFFFVFIFADKFLYNNISVYKADGLIAPSNINIKPVQEHHTVKTFDVSFDFFISDNTPKIIFQTSQGNDGVKIEINAKKELFIIWRNGNNANDLSIDKLGNLKSDELYKMKFLFQKGHKYKLVKYDFTDKDNKSITQKTLKLTKKDYFNPKIDNIELTTGNNFSINYRVKKIAVTKLVIFIVFELLLLLLILSGFFSLLKDKFKQKNKITVDEYIFLALTVSYYPSFIYLHNLFEISFWEFLISISILSLIIISIYFLIGRKYENRLNLFLILVISYIFLAFGGWFIKSEQYDLINHKAVLFYTVLVLAITILITYKIKTNFKKVIQIFLAVLYISLFVSQSQAIAIYLTSFINRGEKVRVNNCLENTPNFYFIIPDMYPNSKLMEKYMGEDNGGFLEFLRNKGFYVIENSNSNYGFTYQSLPSMLNYSYLNDLGVKENISRSEYMSIAGELYKNNKLFKFFKKMDYKIFFLNSGSYICTKPNNVDFIFTNNYFNTPISIISLLLEKSVFSNNKLKSDYTHYRNAKNSFKNLNEIILNDKSSKKLIFAHIMAPHHPFVFDKNGKYTLSETLFEQNGTVQFNKQAYVNQILYVNKLLKEVISNILKADKRAVILITSDHAIHVAYEKEINNKIDVEKRYANFMAVYTFDKNYKNFYDTMTPVSVIRTILNRYYDEHLQIIDKVYLTPSFDKYIPEDITDLIRPSKE